MTISRYECAQKRERALSVNGFRTFLASLRFSSNRFENYYGRIVASGEGYPTADEARQDVRNRDRVFYLIGISTSR